MPKKSPFPFEKPDYIKNDHAGIEATCKLAEGLAKEWHQLRQQGVTLPYLEYQEVIDPELMDKPLTEEYARRKYAKAFKEVRLAKKRNAQARIKGSKAKKETTLTIEKLIALLNAPDSLNNKDLVEFITLYQDKKCSVNKIANIIGKYPHINYSGRSIRRILSVNKSAILISLDKSYP